jgi:hypothetical protein
MVASNPGEFIPTWKHLQGDSAGSDQSSASCLLAVHLLSEAPDPDDGLKSLGFHFSSAFSRPLKTYNFFSVILNFNLISI